MFTSFIYLEKLLNLITIDPPGQISDHYFDICPSSTHKTKVPYKAKAVPGGSL